RYKRNKIFYLRRRYISSVPRFDLLHGILSLTRGYQSSSLNLSKPCVDILSFFVFFLSKPLSLQT
ncbi:hypothetical protein SCA6_011016, partial [Theobroma cacao]